MRRFLEFAVEHRLSSPDQTLKEIIVGAELYPFGGEFDPRLTAAVRVDATRLRAKLREYYSSEGVADALIIHWPKGSYAAVFRAATAQASVQSSAATPANGQPGGEPSRTKPSIAVLPFSNLSPEPGDYFSDGLTEEIIHALSSVEGMCVVARVLFCDETPECRRAGGWTHVECQFSAGRQCSEIR